MVVVLYNKWLHYLQCQKIQVTPKYKQDFSGIVGNTSANTGDRRARVENFLYHVHEVQIVK